MKLRFIIRKFVKKIVCIKVLNVLLKRLVKLLLPVIPKGIVNRIPVVGTVCLQLPDSKKLYLKTDGNDHIASLLYWGGINAYESSTLHLFINLLKYVGTVFDIGANTGMYALIAAIDNPERKVYAFEPVPRILNYLKNNVEINNLYNLQVNSSAVTNYDGDIALYLPPDTIPSSASTLQGFKRDCEIISVPALTIDSFVAINNIPKVDLIKIDTEATEHTVLEGAKSVIKRDEPIIICEVLRGQTEKLLHSAIDNLGYKYFWISSKGLIERKQIEGSGTDDMNYLFITEKKLRGIKECVEYAAF